MNWNFLRNKTKMDKKEAGIASKNHIQNNTLFLLELSNDECVFQLNQLFASWHIIIFH